MQRSSLIRSFFGLLTLLACVFFPASASALSYSASLEISTYTQLSGGTTVFGPGLDSGTSTVSLPASVTVNGHTYTSAAISVDGSLQLLGPTPTTLAPYPADLSTALNGSVKIGQVGNEVIVQWNVSSILGSLSPYTSSFQAVMRTNSNRVTYRYSGLALNLPSASVGLGTGGEVSLDLGVYLLLTGHEYNFYPLLLDAVPTLTNDNTPSFTGTANPGSGDVTARIYAGSTATGSPVASPTGSVAAGTGAYTVTAGSLSDGTYTVQIVQGPAQSSTQTFQLDASAPSLTGTVAAATSSLQPVVSGIAAHGSGDASTVNIKIYSGATATGSPVATVTTAVNPTTGAYSGAPSSPLTEGQYTAQVEQSDSAGNLGQSAPVSLRIDTSSPSLTALPLSSPTNDATPSISGVASTGTGDDTTVTARVYAGLGFGGPLSGTATASLGLGGIYTATLTTPLDDGVYTVRVEQGDAAGNIGYSSSFSITVDTGVPVLSLDALPTAVNTGSPVVTGSASPVDGDVSLKIHTGSTVTGPLVSTTTATPTGTGTFSVSPSTPLAEGTYTVVVTQTDAAGNTGSTADATVSIDLTTPVVVVNTPTGTVSDRTPEVAGVAAHGSGDDNTVRVTLYNGPSVLGTQVATTLVPVAGDGSFAWKPRLVNPTDLLRLGRGACSHAAAFCS
jgi:hypothetical protein